MNVRGPGLQKWEKSSGSWRGDANGLRERCVVHSFEMAKTSFRRAVRECGRAECTSACDSLKHVTTSAKTQSFKLLQYKPTRTIVKHHLGESVRITS